MISPCTSGICSLSSSSFSDLHSSDDEVFRKTDIPTKTRQRHLSHAIQRHTSGQSSETTSFVPSRTWSSTPNLTLQPSARLLNYNHLSLSDGSNICDPRQIVIVPKPRRKISPGLEKFVDIFSVSRPCLLRSLSGDGYNCCGRWDWTSDEWSVWDSRPPERSRSAEQLRHSPYCHESRIQELIYGDNDARSTISQLKTENLELQHLIANSQNSLLENKERIQILKNKMQEQAHLLLCETGQKQALQQDNESLRRQFESLAKMKDDLQDEKDSLEQKYQTLLNSSTKSRHMETSTPRSNKKRHRRRGAGGSGSLNQSGYSSSEEEVVGGGPVNGSRTDSALPESDPSFSRVDGDGVIWKRPSQSSVSHAHPLMASTMRYSPSVTSDDYGQDSGYHIPTSDCSTKPYSQVCSVTSLEGRQPERVFKVVLLGDSAVGKSSFIMRLCHNRFQAAFQPTIGVDFQVKTMLIQNTVVSLQLWDTAGQERFRAITKSYLRRVDGVILMYDVTRESSFRNIRDWIQSIEEEDEAPTIMLLGNKADLIATGDQPRAVKTVDGESLAREYNAMFCEVSAKKGTNIHDCCEDLTRSLMKRENQKIAQTNHNIVPDSKDRTKISDKSCSICS
ncbi:hypothetical protein ACHWQZ_G004008 [Mnemiopsis leidyi]